MYAFDGFEWNEQKRLITLAERNLDFAEVWQIFKDANSITILSARHGEARYKTIGLFKGKLTTVIHTPRGRNCRIISLRRVHSDEKEAYYGNR